MEVVEVDVVTGKKTSLVATAKLALRALNDAETPFAVIGATALGVRGLPRFTADLDVVVYREDALEAIDALIAVGFATDVELKRDEGREPGAPRAHVPLLESVEAPW
jgi:hypothetical protein